MMTEAFRSDPLRMLRWQQRKALFYACTAATAWVLITPLGLESLQLPVMPITVVGAAIVALCDSRRWKRNGSSR